MDSKGHNQEILHLDLQVLVSMSGPLLLVFENARVWIG